MNSDQLLQEVEQEGEGQGWLATFADLMSLLMCFFVLLLSFSELDVLKFKQIAGSMKYAFGVQNQINVEDIPKGTSVIAQEFSPGKPEDTPFNRIEQVTFDRQKSDTEENAPARQKAKRNKQQLNDRRHRELILTQQRIQQAFKDELSSGQFELDNQGQQLVIRIQEQGAFASGSGFLQPGLTPSLKKLAIILQDVPGQLLISGHTDNRPLNNEMYQDNLELSAIRAIAVARVLNHDNRLDKLFVQGMADTQPVVGNATPQQRQQNRRVEITIMQGQARQIDMPSLAN